MLTCAVLEGIVFPDVLVQWLSLFTADFSSLMLKAQGSWSSGKAYAIKYIRREEFLYIHARVGQSFSNATSRAYNVTICFRMQGSPRIIHSLCPTCVGGENSGWCHHIVSLCIGLMQFRMGIIGVGQYNGGDRAWGQARLLMDMPSLASHEICLLIPSQHALRLFPGIKTRFTKPRSRMKEYIRFIQTYGSNDLEKTVNEIHYGDDHPHDAPVRRGVPMPAWDFEESYKQNKLVLEE